MAFTRVVGPGIHTQANIDSHNIHSTGIITATKFDGPFDSINVSGAATFTGNVTIGGTLTYEDVKNVDSVGLITARKGIISSGVVTATAFHGPSQIGIQSAGTQIGAGITQLNFIGAGKHLQFQELQLQSVLLVVEVVVVLVHLQLQSQVFKLLQR